MSSVTREAHSHSTHLGFHPAIEGEDVTRFRGTSHWGKVPVREKFTSSVTTGGRHVGDDGLPLLSR